MVHLDITTAMLAAFALGASGCGSERSRAVAPQTQRVPASEVAAPSAERAREAELERFVSRAVQACSPAELDAPGEPASRWPRVVSRNPCEEGTSGEWLSASASEQSASCERCSYDAAERVRRCRRSEQGDAVSTYDEGGALVRLALDGDLDGVFEVTTTTTVERDSSGRVTRVVVDAGGDGTVDTIRTTEWPAPGVSIERTDDDADGAVDWSARTETDASGLLLRYHVVGADGRPSLDIVCEQSGSITSCDHDDDGDGVVDLRTRTTEAGGRTTSGVDIGGDGVFDRTVITEGQARETWEHTAPAPPAPRGRRGRRRGVEAPVAGATRLAAPRLVSRTVVVEGRSVTYDGDGTLQSVSFDEAHCASAE